MFLHIVVVLFNSIFIRAALLHLTCQQIKKIVDGHNRVRLALTQGKLPNHPAGNNLKLMTWDEEIADKAAEWAKQNKLYSNSKKDLPSKRFITGENMYLHRSLDPEFIFDLDTSIGAWFSEYKKYKYGKLKYSDFEQPNVVGHYTQMIWADTMYIGCAISHFQNGTWNSFLVVCDYGPGGNIINRRPYKIRGNKTNKLLCDHHRRNCNHPYGKTCN